MIKKICFILVCITQIVAAGQEENGTDGIFHNQIPNKSTNSFTKTEFYTGDLNFGFLEECCLSLFVSAVFGFIAMHTTGPHSKKVD